MSNHHLWKNWTLEQFATHYAETILGRPNGWGQYISDIFGQSHYIMIAARKKYAESDVKQAFRAAIAARKTIAE